MKIRIHDILVKCICLIPLITLFSKYPVVSAINRLLTGIMLVLLVYSNIKHGNRKTFVVLVLTFSTYAFSLLKTVWPVDNINEVFYLAFWVLLFNDIATCYDVYVKNIYINAELIRRIIIFWNIFTVISLALPSSYKRATFFSFTGAQHRFASCALMVIALVMIYTKMRNRKKSVVWAVVPIITVMLTGARTYLLVVGIAAACIYYMISDNKYKFYLTIVPIAAIAVFFVMNSRVMTERAAETARLARYYGDAFRALTSGRSVWWAIDLKHFFDSPVINQILGNGYHFIRYVNKTFYGQNIWAHNDYIQLLGTNGYIGFGVYLYSYFRVSKMIINKALTNRKRILVLGFHSMNFLNAMFNMLYTYFCSALAVLLFLMVFFDDHNYTPLIKRMKKKTVVK